jgi:hypothetical protein
MAGANDMSGYQIWAVDNVVYGPVQLPVLVGWVREQRVLADTWIFLEQSSTWLRAADVPELKMFFESQSSPVSPPEPEAHAPLVAGIKPGMLRRVKVFS